MRLWALSDLHVSHPANREALKSFPAYPDDWLILAGDISDGAPRLAWCFRQLTPKFRQVVWVPGNHELWTLPNTAPGLRGVALYERLVQIARTHGVLTPEDPYPVLEHRDGPALIAPLFLLYDYSFRPRHIPRQQVVPWARETGAVCTDEFVLHPDPFPSRDSWCAARCEEAAARLASCPTDVPKVLINHFPLEEEHAVLPRVPRFTPWCGTRRTQGWHRHFNACAVVYGHLHIRGTQWLDGVPFQEVSLGYPNQWDQRRGMGGYLREVTLAPRRPLPDDDPGRPLVESLARDRGLAPPACGPPTRSGERRGPWMSSTTRNDDDGTGFGCNAPSASTRSAARRYESTCVNGSGAKTVNFPSATSNTASHLPR